MVHLSGALYTDIDKIKGVPKAVLRTVVPAVEAFALKLTEPNLRQLNRGLGHYLDRLDGRASRTP
ncbi:MAG: hypothetical protein M5R36_20230 [Deltaproteobacteria bacterium]|nr:hypothetical protein [Deltaproteobacteria bacterium]